MLQLSQQIILLPYHLTDTSEPTNSYKFLIDDPQQENSIFPVVCLNTSKNWYASSIFKQPFMKLGSSCSNQHIPAPFWQKGCFKNSTSALPHLWSTAILRNQTCLKGQAPSQHHGFWRRQTHALALWMWFDGWGKATWFRGAIFCWFPLRLKSYCRLRLEVQGRYTHYFTGPQEQVENDFLSESQETLGVGPGSVGLTKTSDLHEKFWSRLKPASSSSVQVLNFQSKKLFFKVTRHVVKLGPFSVLKLWSFTVRRVWLSAPFASYIHAGFGRIHLHKNIPTAVMIGGRIHVWIVSFRGKNPFP